MDDLNIVQFPYILPFLLGKVFVTYICIIFWHIKGLYSLTG